MVTTEKIEQGFTSLERGVHAALETYSNVHRGSGHYSAVSTYLYEQARTIVLDHLGLNKDRYTVIFCTPQRAETFKVQLKPKSFQVISSGDIGLPIGVRALAADKRALPGGVPSQTGGGTTRLVSPAWVIWAEAPDRFEAGTPAIINVIAFARALCLTKHSGRGVFDVSNCDKLTADEILYNSEPGDFSGKALLEELRKTIIGRGKLVPTNDGTRPYVNLDNAASTPALTPVWNAVCSTWRQPAEIQQKVINEVRKICAGILGAPMSEYDIIFTINTTEAINLVAQSLTKQSGRDIEPVILNTILEHNSNDLPWRLDPGHTLIRLTADPEGFVDPDLLDSVMSDYNERKKYGKKRIVLVSVTGASNVLGVFNNLEEISRIVHRYEARLLVDAAQLVAHRKVTMDIWGIDYLAFSAHKVYAPFGTGVLVARKGMLNFTPDELNQITSSGEENVIGIAALGKSLLLLQRIGLDLIQKEEQDLTAYLLNSMRKIPGLRIHGVRTPDSPKFGYKGGVIVFDLKNAFANVIARELANRGGIGIRYGCHCAHLLIKYLVGVGPFLEQFQGIMLRLLPQIRLPGLARVSLGIGNTREDIDILIRVLGHIARQPGIKKNKLLQGQMNDFITAVSEKVYSLP